MDYRWLMDLGRVLERIERQTARTQAQVEELATLVQRLAILAALWAGVAALGYNSQETQELLTGAIRVLLKLPSP
jgi:hypothetical protein